MIASIIVENFKSFDKRTELSMVSSSKIRMKSEHRVEVARNLKLLKHAAIYGANASGKSNLVEFISFFIRVLKDGLPIDSDRLYCRNREENNNRDSCFEIRLEQGGRFYAYGFSALLSERRITGEWLYELHLNGSSACIFERESGLSPVIGKGLSLTEEEKMRFSTYASDFSENTSGLFLGEMNRGKKYSDDTNFKVFEAVYRSIVNQIVVITPNSRFINFQQYYNADSLARINDLIKTFDTGISNIRIEEIDLNELERMIPRQILKSMIEDINKKKRDNPNTPARISGRSDNSFFSIELDETGEMKINTIKMKHGNSICDFGFDEESDGTRRLFDLMDILMKQSDDTVYFIDELERSLHPKLTEHFLELFSKLHSEEKIQIVFTTHESSVMDQKIFRRDEIWFIERDEENNSRIYSLDHFKERYDKKLSKAYLEGRYGAIPVFKKFEF